MIYIPSIFNSDTTLVLLSSFVTFIICLLQDKRLHVTIDFEKDWLKLL